ncbi:MAG: hypothetical protein AAF490_24560, partial [Chloroflexota bacterium]
MKISFKKRPGPLNLGITFFWELRIDSEDSLSLPDNLIPESFFDYFFIHRGTVVTHDEAQLAQTAVPPQCLKPIHTRRLRLTYHLPLTVYGARLTPRFAAGYLGRLAPANSLIEADWLTENPRNLEQFSKAVKAIVQSQWNDTAVAYLTPQLEETAQFKTYSPRHKRRLF